jgi:hypothetical protein
MTTLFLFPGNSHYGDSYKELQEGIVLIAIWNGCQCLAICHLEMHAALLVAVGYKQDVSI